MNKKVIYAFLMLLCVLGFWLFENFCTPSTYTDPHIETADLAIEEIFYPSSTTGQIIHHSYYSLSYHEKYEQAEWVLHHLNQNHLTYDDRERPLFIEDPKVKSKSADWKNYRGSGYDRGHLVPAGDRRFSEYAYNETFYTSNISPQNAEFNAGIWNKLEQKVRYWCKRYGDLYVITGGVLQEDLKTIGSESVSVPNYFYKIIARKDGKNLKLLGFLFPHKPSTASLYSFVVPVDEIERRTGIDFFEKLPNSLEDSLEKTVNTSGWKF